MDSIQLGLPGVSSRIQARHRKLLWTDQGAIYSPKGLIIDGSKGRDSGNTGDIDVLRAGMVMGKITSGGKYAPSILGLTGALHDTSVVTTVMTLPAAVVTEIARRIGASGTFNIVGPPAAAGVVDVETVTYSAIASATTLTITATTADFAAGSMIMPTDGSQNPLVIVGDGHGIKLTDGSGTSIDVPFTHTGGGNAALIAGCVNTDQIVDYTSEASTKLWLKRALNGSIDDAGTIAYKGYGGRFIFSDDF